MLRKISLFILLATITAHAATEQEARRFCQQWFPAWNGGANNTDRLYGFYTNTAVYCDPWVPRGVSGEALRNFFRQLLTNTPEMNFQIRAIYPTERGFVLHYEGSVKLASGIEIQGFAGVDIVDLDVENSKITRQVGFYDTRVFSNPPPAPPQR